MGFEKTKIVLFLHRKIVYEKDSVEKSYCYCIVFASINQSIPYNFLSLDHHLIAQLNVDLDYETESENEKEKEGEKESEDQKEKYPIPFNVYTLSKKNVNSSSVSSDISLEDTSRTIFLPPPEHLF